VKLQVTPNSWSCMPTALAILLDEPVDKIIKLIGQDGSERGFHIQELILVALKYNKALIHLDMYARVSYRGEEFNEYDDSNIIYEMMKYNEGILLGTTKNGQPHSVAWDKEKIFDPTGHIYVKGFFNIETFLLCKTLVS
jgi:hypothetical protein